MWIEFKLVIKNWVYWDRERGIKDVGKEKYNSMSKVLWSGVRLGGRNLKEIRVNKETCRSSK